MWGRNRLLPVSFCGSQVDRLLGSKVFCCCYTLVLGGPAYCSYCVCVYKKQCLSAVPTEIRRHLWVPLLLMLPQPGLFRLRRFIHSDCLLWEQISLWTHRDRHVREHTHTNTHTSVLFYWISWKRFLICRFTWKSSSIFFSLLQTGQFLLIHSQGSFL